MSNTMFEAMLLDRVVQLEKSNKRQRKMFLVTFAILTLVTTILFASAFGLRVIPGKVVQADKFVLTDSSGVNRMEMRTQNGISMMAFLNDAGLPRLAIANAKGDPGFHLYDARGFRQAAFGLGADGPSLTFMTELGNQKAGLITRKDGSAALITRNGEYEYGSVSEMKYISLDELDSLNKNTPEFQTVTN
ncbi:MAG: hypothetical protein P9L94_09940 [Candidatus Hinthialibacter antarcticus]|nr:hypothetical protein [Candidatus Hinthialibacter antarcticus]